MVGKLSPRQSEVCLFFVVVCAKHFPDIFAGSKIFTGNSPAGPPTCGWRLDWADPLSQCSRGGGANNSPWWWCLCGGAVLVLARIPVLFLLYETYGRGDFRYLQNPNRGLSCCGNCIRSHHKHLSNVTHVVMGDEVMNLGCCRWRMEVSFWEEEVDVWFTLH